MIIHGAISLLTGTSANGAPLPPLLRTTGTLLGMVDRSLAFLCSDIEWEICAIGTVCPREIPFPSIHSNCSAILSSVSLGFTRYSCGGLIDSAPAGAAWLMVDAFA